MPFELSNLYGRILLEVWLEPEPDDDGERELLYRGRIPQGEVDVGTYELDWGGYMRPELEYFGEGQFTLVVHVFNPEK